MKNLALICLHFLITACASPQMTRELRNSIPPDQLGKIQYAISDEVILRRTLAVSERGVTDDHNIRVIDGKRIEEVVFPKNSPGVMISSDSLSLSISFETGPLENPNPTLRFEIDTETDKYALISSQTTDYMGKPFQICVGGLDSPDAIVNKLTSNSPCSTTRKAHLVVDLARVKRTQRERRTVSGRKIKE